jgi:FAD:protein FMN transferase
MARAASSTGFPPLAMVIAISFSCLEGQNALAEEPLRISGKTMGSYDAVVVDSPGSANASDLQAEIEATFAHIGRQMSTWDENSEMSRFNRSTSTDWFSVGKDFAIVVQEAKRVHEISGGAFDPTLALLIDAWGFGVKKARRDIPTDEAISNALRNVGMQHVEVRVDPPAIRKAIPELRLNLSAIAPGYATDEICRILRKHQLSSHVVDVGGENRAGMAKSNGDAWRVGVESPLDGNLHKILKLTDKAIARAGDQRNFFMAGGKKYAHILDPKTGRPVDHPPASVSVIHGSCMTADALCTALMVLGTDRGLELAKTIQSMSCFWKSMTLQELWTPASDSSVKRIDQVPETRTLATSITILCS